MTIRDSGRGCFAPRAVLTVVLTGNVLGTTESDENGRFATIVTIPRNTAPGTHRLTVTGRGATGGTHTSSATFVVSGGTLVRTGGQSGDMTRLAVFSVGLGLLLVFLGRRRIPAYAAKHFHR